MILVTVGMQLGFDRLIEAMDSLALDLGLPIIAQTGPGSYRPQNLQILRKIPPSEFEALMEQAQLIVSHAGIGTVLTAARLSKPIVLVPRRASLAEHRNDHQLATVRNLKDRPGIFIAETIDELEPRIREGLKHPVVSHLKSAQSVQLNQAVEQFVEMGVL